jgi:hypothetical protein
LAPVTKAKEYWETFEGAVIHRTEVPFPDSSLCTKAFPFCIKSNYGLNSHVQNNESTFEYSCVECRSDCDCPIGKYCSIANGINVKDFGRCVSYGSVVGKKCDPDFGESADVFDDLGSASKDRDLIANPDKYCVLMRSVKRIENVYYPATGKVETGNSTYVYPAFKGACVLGTCRECNSLLTYKKFDENAVEYRYDSQGRRYYPFFNQMGECQPSSNAFIPWYSKFVTSGSASNSAHVSQYMTKPRYCHNFKFHYLNDKQVAE